MTKIRENTGRNPAELSADQGYLSEANIKELRRRRVRGYIAVGRRAHHSGWTSGHRGVGFQSKHVRAMAARVRRGGYRSRYRLRKQIVEPVNGQIKEARNFRRFSMRGLTKSRGEWAMICTAHNLLKLARYGRR